MEEWFIHVFCPIKNIILSLSITFQNIVIEEESWVDRFESLHFSCYFIPLNPAMNRDLITLVLKTASIHLMTGIPVLDFALIMILVIIGAGIQLVMHAAWWYGKISKEKHPTKRLYQEIGRAKNMETLTDERKLKV